VGFTVNPPKGDIEVKKSNVPIASKVAFWMVVAIVSLTIAASVIASIVLEDAYWGGFAVGYFGGHSFCSAGSSRSSSGSLGSSNPFGGTPGRAFS
jgi:hypothetical protein